MQMKKFIEVTASRGRESEKITLNSDFIRMIEPYDYDEYYKARCRIEVADSCGILVAETYEKVRKMVTGE